MDKPTISTTGFWVGVIAWVAMVFLLAMQSSCAEFKACGTGDLVMSGLLAAGMLAPAWVVAVVVSIAFPGKKR